MLVSISSLVDKFWNIFHSISCIVTHFCQLQFKFVGHSSWARDSKNNFVYRHSFSSKFQSNSSPRCRGPITLDEFEWQNIDIVRRNDGFDPTFLTRLATQTNFSDNWRFWMLNLFIFIDQKTNIWMPIWRTWTLWFGRSKLLRTKMNWKLMKLNEKVTKMGGKTYNIRHVHWETVQLINIGFPAHFHHLFIQFFKNVFSVSSRTLWDVRMLVSISSLDDQFWNTVIQFRAFVTRFCQLLFKFVGHSS